MDLQPELDGPLPDDINAADFIYPMWLLRNDLNFYLTSNENSLLREFESEDILDMHLLGSKRVTFTSKLLRHPYLLRKIYRENTPIVLSPVSNPILQKTDAIYHSHPAAILFDFNLPLLLSSEYPALWRTAPLTMDYYLMLMRMGDSSADIRILKQFAYNSLIYSEMDANQKLVAIAQWNTVWTQWICKLQNVNV